MKTTVGSLTIDTERTLANDKRRYWCAVHGCMANAAWRVFVPGTEAAISVCAKHREEMNNTTSS